MSLSSDLFFIWFFPWRWLSFPDAAQLHADLLLVYTLDTAFRIKDHDIGPLGVITLGFLPNHEARITTTASAVLFDVRTAYVYGLVEATEYEEQMASAWTARKAVEDARKKAERKAFEQLLNRNNVIHRLCR